MYRDCGLGTDLLATSHIYLCLKSFAELCLSTVGTILQGLKIQGHLCVGEKQKSNFFGNGCLWKIYERMMCVMRKCFVNFGRKVDNIRYLRFPG